MRSLGVGLFGKNDVFARCYLVLDALTLCKLTDKIRYSACILGEIYQRLGVEVDVAINKEIARLLLYLGKQLGNGQRFGRKFHRLFLCRYVLHA